MQSKPKQPVPAASISAARQLLEDHYQAIQTMARDVGRRFGFSTTEGEDFVGWVALKLVSHDYAVLRRFGGKSTLTTYLHTVVRNLGRDYRNRLWGKWRPCAKAQRLGIVAIRLDVLLHRDNLPFEEAVQILRTNEHFAHSPEELGRIAEHIRRPHGRRRDHEATLPEILDTGGVERSLQDSARKQLANRLQQALRSALLGLDEEDRRILEQRYRAGKTVASISRELGLDQKRLYRRIDRSVTHLRRDIEDAGFELSQLGELLAWRDLSVTLSP